MLNQQGALPTIRNRVRQVRVGQGLSQSELARRARITRDTLRKIERDNGYPADLRVVVAICVALRLRLSSLWWIEPDPEVPATPADQA